MRMCRAGKGGDSLTNSKTQESPTASAPVSPPSEVGEHQPSWLPLEGDIPADSVSRLQCWVRREGRAKLAAAGDFELGVDAVQMCADRPMRQKQPLSDVSV